MTQDTKIKAVGHTAGPWIVDLSGIVNARIMKGGFMVAKIRKLAHAWDTQVADAHLIAASPDLLTALRKLANEVGGLRVFESELRAELGNTNWNVLMRRLADADAAIAKAEGRAS